MSRKDVPLTHEECIQLVRSNITDWNKSLDKIDDAIRQWRQYLDEHRASTKHPTGPGPSRFRSDSLQSLNEDKHALSRGGQLGTDSPRQNHVSHAVQKPLDVQDVVFFHAESQSLLEQLVKKLQMVRNRLIRTIATHDLAIKSRAVTASRTRSGAGSLKFAETTRIASPSQDRPEALNADLKRVEGLLKQSMDECEKAAYQLLRRGTCCTQLQTIKKCFGGCAAAIGPQQLVTARTEAQPQNSTPSTSMATKWPTSSSPLDLEVDKADDSGEDDTLDAKLDALRLHSKRMASRGHGQ